MFDFRKVLLATVAGLGLVATASAQVPQCTAAFTQGYVAVEGQTEELPQISLTCASSATFSGTSSFTFTSSVPFTNQTQPSPATNLDVLATDTNADQANGITITQPGPSTITVTFANVTTVALVAGVSTNVFTVTGLRVNPSALPVSSAVTLTITSSAYQMATASASALNVAFVAKTLGVVSVDTTANPAIPAAQQSACGIGGTTAAPNLAVYPASNINITAGFTNSLKQTSDYTTTPLALFGNDTAAVAAKQGTRLAITFSNLNPAGVNYFVPASITGVNVTLTAYTAASGGASVAATPVSAGTTLTNLTNAWAAGASPYTVLGQTPPAAATQLTVAANGTATIYYGVTGGTTTAGPQQFSVEVLQQVPQQSAVTSFVSTPISISVAIVGVAAPGYPQASSSAVAYPGAAAGTNTTLNGLLTSCGTTILFPYVTNTNTFDTGLAVTNASTGLTAANFAATSGSCTLTFYGSGGTGTSTTPFSTTLAVTTGATNTVDVAALDSGFQGYIVAQCNFLGAHGYAFLFSTVDGGIAGNYLAPIVSSGGGAYTPAPGAITPLF